MRVHSLIEQAGESAGPGSPSLAAAVDRYIDGPRPLFARLPFSYRLVPLWARMSALRTMARIRPVPSEAFPAWPYDRRVDDELSRHGIRLSYGGRSTALVITHDIDSGPELADIDRVRAMERAVGLPSAFGFVPDQSWPSEDVARSLVAEGCEVYWHDIGHDGRLPYLGVAGIRDAFDRVSDRSPWSVELMTAFRAGQLLVSRELMQVVSERFAIDMSIPDTEHHGPYGGAAGCGTVFPFRLDGLLELPLTMPQEVYLRHVYGLSATEALDVWLAKLAYVRERGGVAVFNIHPIWIDRSHPDMLDAFKGFLDAVVSMDDVLVSTPSSLVPQIARADDGGTIGGLPTRTGLPDSTT